MPKIAQKKSDWSKKSEKWRNYFANKNMFIGGFGILKGRVLTAGIYKVNTPSLVIECCSLKLAAVTPACGSPVLDLKTYGFPQAGMTFLVI